MTEPEVWREEVRAFVRVIEGRTQDDAAALDPAFNQKDISRWRRGVYKREPSEPKMAAIRRVLSESDPTDEARREAYLTAAEEVEAVAAKLRVLATAPTSAGDRAERGRESRTESKRAQEKREKARRKKSE